MAWERAFDPVKIVAKEGGGVRVGITARITKIPKLIMLSYGGVIAKGIDHWRPARSRFLQAVNENYRRPRRIELLQPGKQRRIAVGFRVQDSRKPKPFWSFTSNQHRRRRIKISSKRKGLSVQRDSFSV